MKSYISRKLPKETRTTAPIFDCTRASLLLFRSRRQALVNRGDEVVGGAEALLGAPASVVVEREAGLLDLLEGHAFLNGVLDTVADDCHHFPVFPSAQLMPNPAIA